MINRMTSIQSIVLATFLFGVQCQLPGAEQQRSKPAIQTAPAPPASAISTVNTPQHSPGQLDFGTVQDGLSSRQTFSLTTNASGYVTVSIPAGPFRIAEFREMAPLQGGSKNAGGQPAATAIGGVKSRIRYQEGQTGPYQWSMAANAVMQVDLIFAPTIKGGTKVGQVLGSMNVSGPGPRGNWSLAIPLRGVLGNLVLTPEPPTPKRGGNGGSSNNAPSGNTAGGQLSSDTFKGQTRSIASLTPTERIKLPQDTMVKLDLGRTSRIVSLGPLSAEHRARLDRFAKAVALGRMVAGTLTPQPAGSRQPASPPIKPARSGTENQNISANRAVMQSQISPFATLMPFQPPLAKGTIPNDYVDFCKAANASACLYLPANAGLTDPPLDLPLTWWVQDFDYLITDNNVCKGNGGYPTLGGCAFYYPINHTINFVPTGQISSTVSCEPPSVTQLDPKGAAKVVYPFNAGTLNLAVPVSCVMQVWMSK
jgi:hypothetical protein